MTGCAGAGDVSHDLYNTLGLDEQTFGPGSIPGKGRDFALSTACTPDPLFNNTGSKAVGA